MSAFIVISFALLSSWAENRVRASLEARTYVERFIHAVVEAERSQRAYILTQDREYLADYEYALQKIGKLAEQLREIVARNRIENDAIEELYRLAGERNSQLTTAIEVLHARGFSAAVEEVRRNEVRQTTNQILDLVATIGEEENRLLGERERQVTLLRGTLLGVLLFVLTGTFLFSTVSFEREHRMAERLADLNRDLEGKVGERTRQLELERRRVENLLADMSHRLGNNLSMLSSYLVLEARRTTDPGARETLEDVHQRIVSVASAQRRLQINSATSAVDIRAYLEALIRDIRCTLVREGICLELSAEALLMRGDDAVSLGIIVNELVVNSLKYAFPSDGGFISVSVCGKNDDVVVEVVDDGAGIDSIAQEGLGSLVVQSMVSTLAGRSAHTSARSDLERPGTRWRVQFPLRHPPAQDYADQAV
ncbi:sensor histidine kinase [Aquibium oceanicum]|uniref:sensor histidine kinase n=1 Tax=Aquibium oceanicum TaxID=1670800 RepID=UPI0013903532|nr:CHASE3 domain-containing protein [Aquibium oceanicum]